MRIVIDLQGAQSSCSRSRGIGRYSLSIALAIARNRGEHEVVIALNGVFHESIQHVRNVFQDVLPQENICIWQAPDLSSYSDPSNIWRRQAAELTREAFLAGLNPSVLVVSSLFEGLSDDAITSVGKFAKTIPTAVILYDLIPLINRSPYLDNSIIANWYDEKIGYLRCTNQLLAISESSRQEGVKYLDFSDDCVTNISTAADSQFRVREISSARKSALYAKYNLDYSFVMYTGGIDHRKNIEGLIRAYAKLPLEIRQSHQLTIVCSIQPNDRYRIEALAKQQGMKLNELILTGYVPEDDLIDLYNMCKAFIFPSWHEGFGLPVLEAMSCGCAVICANTSSLPEVVDCDEAMFDPFDDGSITKKLEQVLTDDAFRHALEQHGLKQSKRFSWDKTAQKTLLALEDLNNRSQLINSLQSKTVSKPRLAYISPLPPERSGISDYSAELLPQLYRYYDIDVVIIQDTISSPWVEGNCSIRTVDWFREHATEFDRVLYHFGNSTYHKHMFSLLESIPGVVVLHDFFLSGVISYLEVVGGESGLWSDALYAAHGYTAIQHRFNAIDIQDVIWKYPCNYSVLQNSLGVIVHSESSRQLAKDWYGKAVGDGFQLIPLLRAPGSFDKENRQQARQALGLDAQDFVVCSFGLLGPSKLNHRLLKAWLDSPLCSNSKCKLIFVGENSAGTYGQDLLANINNSKFSSRIHITGWVDTDKYHKYLVAADVGVQLRTLSRGETSAAVLDCMNYGLATIVNANGSMADLSDDGVLKVSDEFSDAELVGALTTLLKNVNQRDKLGEDAKKIILTQHNPEVCADQYYATVEHFYHTYDTSLHSLIREIAKIEPVSDDNNDFMAVAKSIDQSIASSIEACQLLIDITHLVQQYLNVDDSIAFCDLLKELLLNAQTSGCRVEPIYRKVGGGSYYYARNFTLELLKCPKEILDDDPVSYRQQDVFVRIDFQSNVFSTQNDIYSYMIHIGVRVENVSFDKATDIQQLKQAVLALIK